MRFSYGATEAKVPDIADAVVEITETGRAIRAAGLRIIDTLIVSYTELIANRASCADPDKATGHGAALVLLEGTLGGPGQGAREAQRRRPTDLDAVIDLLPAMKSPTVSKLFGDEAYAVETVVPKSDINVLIPALKERGATDIIELALSQDRPLNEFTTEADPESLGA